MSKKVKTFNEKQKNLTESQLAALEHLRTKGMPKKSIKKVLTPEELDLQDVKFNKDEKNPVYQEGKIITEETLKKEQEEEKKELERYNEEFRKQLSEWITEDHHSEYKNLKFNTSDYLVRIFAMDVSGFEKFVTVKYEWSKMLNNFKLANAQVTDNVYPIVKILKIGSKAEQDYKVGDIVLVPSMEVMGDDWNPRFLEYMKHQRSQGMNPVLPEGMRQRLPKVEINWERLKFVRPWVGLPEEQDHLTFLIPEHKITAEYEFEVNS
jgi:DNA-binding transcriptional MerR regulator